MGFIRKLITRLFKGKEHPAASGPSDTSGGPSVDPPPFVFNLALDFHNTTQAFSEVTNGARAHISVGSPLTMTTALQRLNPITAHAIAPTQNTRTQPTMLIDACVLLYPLGGTTLAPGAPQPELATPTQVSPQAVQVPSANSTSRVTTPSLLIPPEPSVRRLPSRATAPRMREDIPHTPNARRRPVLEGGGRSRPAGIHIIDFGYPIEAVERSTASNSWPSGLPWLADDYQSPDSSVEDLVYPGVFGSPDGHRLTEIPMNAGGLPSISSLVSSRGVREENKDLRLGALGKLRQLSEGPSAGVDLIQERLRSHRRNVARLSTTLTSASSASGSYQSFDDARFRILEYNGHMFTVQGEIGRGTFGFVWSALTEDNEEVAIKVMHKRKMLYDMFRERQLSSKWNYALALNNEVASIVRDEVEALKRVTEADCPFLTPLLCSFSDDTNFYLVMRMYPEDLRHRLAEPVDKRQVQIWAAELLVALEKLHHLKMIHRDVKPENILISPAGHICLADFGLAYVAGPEVDLKRVELKDYCGTAGYLAPEQDERMCEIGYDYRVDIYAYGLTLLEMIIGRGKSWFEILDSNFDPRQGFADNPQIPKLLKKIKDLNAHHLLKRLLEVQPENRPDWEKIRRFPFFAGIDWDQIETRSCAHPYQPSTVAPERRAPELPNDLGRYDPVISYQGRLNKGIGALKVDYECPAGKWRDKKHLIRCTARR
ncbi:kinase-like protein [Leucogyrophana mollusca]|uniref:Kinase-like protein n=1 Tax=Leucogyrophana mollusca TaxID=85980 RepID=A0ACB8B371_9AGAM|nr:kinase-like protein [Leucogyrophana mollusca]